MSRDQPQDRIGDWIQTYSGGCFYPLDPRPSEVEIVDIAHALGMSCRYGGHSLKFYSVAEHAYHVSFHVPPEFGLWGLMHDAAEAYTTDLPRPLKHMIPQWEGIESKIMYAICRRFDMDTEEPKIVHEIDYRIVSDERAQIMAPCIRQWVASSRLEPLGVEIHCWSPEVAKEMFLERFYDLFASGLDMIPF